MPGENIQDWSTTAINNSTADSSIDWHEHMPRASVNDSARSMMAAHAKDRNLKNGSIVTAGTANAQTFNSGYSPAFTTIPTGFQVRLKAGAGLSNTGPMTLSMDGIAPVAVKSRSGNDTVANDFIAGGYVDLFYNGTNWIVWTATSTLTIVQPPAIIVDPGVLTVNFTDLTSDFKQYIAIATGVLPAVMDDALSLRLSTDNGATFLADANYNNIFVQYLASDGAANPTVDTLAFTTEMALSFSLDNTDGNYTCDAEVHLFGAGTPTTPQIQWVASQFYTSLYGLTYVTGAAQHLIATNVNAIQFGMFSGGNILRGQFTIYGVK